MTCRICGCYAPPDTETGYDAEDICPSCGELAEVIEEAFGDEPDEIDQVVR